MTRLEFKKYIEEKLDRELFEEKAMKSIKERAGESDDEQKELSENQVKQIIKQMWSQIIENAYVQIKKDIKKKHSIDDWKKKIDELSEIINESFNEN